MKNRVDVLHGVNFDVLDRRPGDIYGGLKLTELERIKGSHAISAWRPVSSRPTTRASTASSSIARARAPTGWCSTRAHGRTTRGRSATPWRCPAAGGGGAPSEVDSREDWRSLSVIRDICVGRVQGKGVDGYRDALELLWKELG